MILTASALSIWFGTVWAYVAVMHAKAIMERGELNLFWKVNLYPLACIGLVLDVAFNAVVGTVLFQEPPRELLFTSRVKRHVSSGGRRGRMAAFWKRQLNIVDPGHV